ncbi:RDD family protein [Mucilaginibacter sp. Bleaf8]|uniref:RDD family protein n=1 Tax=Mucilaginibacter sp. Bleaf8 TaxID=2834430 RepID=UPI001BCC88C6|nr:RDD family protein [Mucilaginibacter sp. Bleaf8]MBS7566081.1 RDD family protein [Mucilaginibacter sp. Bleaf8]
MQTVRITTSQNITIDYEVAGLGERMLAYLVDAGIFIILYLLGILIGVGGAVAGGSGAGLIVLVIIYFALFVFYDLACEIFMNGQSFGKRVMKIKVVSLNGGQPSIGQYLLRWIFRIVDMSLTSGVCAIVTIAASGKSQRLGDIVAGTTLIKTEPRSKMDQIAHMPVADVNYEPVYKEAGNLTDKDVALIHEVIQTYMQTGNTAVVYSMANQIKQHLNISIHNGMDELLFLQTVVKDYNHLTVSSSYNFNA